MGEMTHMDTARTIESISVEQYDMIYSPDIRDLEPSVSSTKKKCVAPRREVPTGAPSPLFA